MKKVFVSLFIALMGGLLTVPDIVAQGGRGGNQSSASQSGQRSGRSSTSGTGNTRPSNTTTPSRPSGTTTTTPSRPGNTATPSRPGGTTTTTPSRPGNTATPSRPGGTTTTTPSRPGNMTTPSRPSTPPAASRPTRPGASTPSRPAYVVPPTRPGRPIFGTWTRPVPPATWHPTYRYNVVSDILGMTFGLTINSALDYLYSSGYNVDGYGTQEVYLRNVSEMGYTWDDATLYFSSNGLVRSQFYESSTGYNTSRFYGVYNQLLGSYGSPVSQSNNGSTITATWFGYYGDYVTLQYTLMNSSTGYRYFTILTYGN